ncbi:hypothetical protein KAX02_13645 [candidate division WOR-3 bacterium]|nr:hypothetical protein [candidate division WOR-3 bacterium]
MIILYTLIYGLIAVLILAYFGNGLYTLYQGIAGLIGILAGVFVCIVATITDHFIKNRKI